MLDKSLFGFFSRCFKINIVISKYEYFLRFFERRNLYRYLTKKKVSRKNEVTRELSACIIKKFNGYNMIKKSLEKKEKKEFKPIDVTYEPNFDKETPVLCYFAPKIHLAYRSHIRLFKKGVEKVCNRTVRQCHYCDNFFAKTEEKMNHHISVCSAKEGFNYSFDNAEIIDYQDNYKYMGDIPFSAYLILKQQLAMLFF